MVAAIQRLEQGDISVRAVARLHQVPYATLYRYAVEYGRHSTFQRKKRGRKPVLSEETEADLVEFVKECAERKVPMMRTRLRLEATLLGRNTGEAWTAEGQEATSSWVRSLLRRHADEISTRSAQWLSPKRVVCKGKVAAWFDKYEEWRDANPDISKGQIYNMDEIIFSGSGRKPKVLAPRSEHEVQILDVAPTSHVAVIVCGNAEGDFLPPPLRSSGWWIRCCSRGEAAWDDTQGHDRLHPYGLGRQCSL